MKLSVIVPVYNVEDTLTRCVKSIVAQDVDDMEIILVNDGSTDHSGSIAQELAKKHSIITLINQDNKGLSSARNTGIDMSTGKYITFVDSDDWLKPNTYKSLLKILDEHSDCDILEYSFEKRRNNSIENIVLSNEFYTSPRNYWLEGKGFKHTYAWNKIFNRGQFFLTEVSINRFLVGKVFEDISLISQLLKNSPKIITSSIIGYVYEWNPKGITEKAKGKELSQLLSAHIIASKNLNMNFISDSRNENSWVSKEETELYLSILNIQISEYRYTDNQIVLPYFKVHTKSFNLSIIMRVKVLIHNFCGLNILCRLFSI